jgi:MSHA biogenesis protein MshK
MSLINDALKRAKAAQDHAPHVAVPELRFRQPLPPEPAKKGAWYILLLLTCGMLTLAAICFFALRKPEQPLVVNAATRQPIAQKILEPNPGPSIAQTSPATWDNSSEKSTPATPDASAATHKSNSAAEPTQPAQQSPPADSVVTQQSQPVQPAVVATAPPPRPKPAETKLQGIFWSPARPSAMINGRTVFVGDRVGDLRVLAIDQVSATLVGAGHTNVLSLSE